MTLLSRRLPKRISPPPLSLETTALVTRLCFKEEREETADIIFLFVTNVCHNEAADIIDGLLRRGVSKRVIITGGITKFLDEAEDGEIESSKVLSSMDKELLSS